MVQKPIIFISGPFRGKPQNIEWLRQQNIRRAEAAALFVWRHGGVAICPHKNTEHFDGAAEDSIWLEGDLLILQRCDAIYLVTDWMKSDGACKEYNFAVSCGKALLHDEQDVKDYINGLLCNSTS